MNYKRVLVTGGAGFVGSNLAQRWKSDYPQCGVVALDNLKRRGSELNLVRLKEAGVEFVHGDIRNPEDFANLGGCDLLIECSAEPSVLAGYDGAAESLIRINLMGAVNCLEHARKVDADIVFLSSSRVYSIPALNQLILREEAERLALEPHQSVPGISSDGVSENFPISGTRSLYGTTKLAAELIIAEYRQMYDLRAIINRCGVIAGPWQMGKVDQGIVALWVAHHIFGKPPSYIGFGGTGKQVRDVLHIDDLYRLLCIELREIDRFDGEVFNVGGGAAGSVSLRELTLYCQEITGKTVPIDKIKTTRPADIPYFVSDCSQIFARSGWRAEYTPDRIIADTAAWISAHSDRVRSVFQ